MAGPMVTSGQNVLQPTHKTADIIGALRPTKSFKLSKPEVIATSLDFDDSGEFLLAACSDESLQLYNAKEGRHIKTLFSKKYGAHLARFTHHSQSIIYASTKLDDTIRYLSTHDNQFLRYFKGHTAAVTTLALCPASDAFVSASLDNTLRLWTLGSPNAQGRLNITAPTLAAYDPSATVLAVASPALACVLLYDLRNYDKAPFATFDLRPLDGHPHVQAHTISQSPPPPNEWTKLAFSNDGKYVLISTNHSSGHILLNAFDGSLAAFLTRAPSLLPLDSTSQRAPPWPPQSSMRSPGQGDTSFTADGRFVVGASGGDRDAVVWDVGVEATSVVTLNAGATKVLTPTSTLPGGRRIGVVEWNPRYNMLATGDRDVVFWLPDEYLGRKEG